MIFGGLGPKMAWGCPKRVPRAPQGAKSAQKDAEKNPKVLKISLKNNQKGIQNHLKMPSRCVPAALCFLKVLSQTRGENLRWMSPRCVPYL